MPCPEFGEHEAARIHHVSRRSGGLVADYLARATAGDAAGRLSGKKGASGRLAMLSTVVAGRMTETRKIAAILAADVVGYSRLAGADEDRTLARLRALRSDLIDPTIAVHHGRIVKRTGDGALVEFRSVVDAVRCAM